MSGDKTQLGDRMKLYEGIEAQQILLPLAPVVARLDGKNFHTFCRGLKRPYDERLSNLMMNVTTFLVEETNALIGYTQSDEITLVWKTDDIDSQTVPFNGRVQKMCSVLAALATAKFNQLLPAYIPEKAGKLPIFDCRVWSVPSKEEAANAILWRELDATRNSVQMAGHAYFSHKSLQKKNTSEIQEMLFSQKGINWNDYPAFFKRGTFIQRCEVERQYTPDQLKKLKPDHPAHTDPTLTYRRSVVQRLEMPPFRRVANRVAVIFEGATPQPIVEDVGSSPGPAGVGQGEETDPRGARRVAG